MECCGLAKVYIQVRRNWFNVYTCESLQYLVGRSGGIVSLCGYLRVAYQCVINSGPLLSSRL